MRTVYYEMEDSDLEGRWYLRGLFDNRGIELDARDFTYGVPADLGPPVKASLWNDYQTIETEPPLHVLLDPKRPGFPLDVTYTSADMPVVTSKVGMLLASIAHDDIQRIPVRVESRDETYEIINVRTRIDCIDQAKSEILWFEEGNDIRPDLAGQPKMVRQLVIAPEKVGGHQMFRVAGWTIALIVSKAIKDALEAHKVSGVSFTQVSP
jgi:hypothetical protein